MVKLYTFHMFNKKGEIVYYHEWSRPYPRNVNVHEETKTLFGLFFTMNQFAMKMDPMKGALGDNHFRAFRTNNYKFHFYETKTGLRLLLTTEPGCADLHEHLRVKIHQTLYVDGVLKRGSGKAGYAANAPFECDAFREGLLDWGKKLAHT